MIKTVSRATVSGTINAPASKSYAQRAIAAALLTEGRTTLTGMELCSDTRAALEVAKTLGATCDKIGESKYLITGGLNPVTSTISVGESGLSARMFTPIAALWRTPVTVTGHGTICSRPMDMIIDPLRELGVEVRSGGGLLPLTVTGPIVGGETTVDGSVSSQFITGLLMALPLAEHDTTFHVTSVNSTPYIDMTLDVLDRFGIETKHNGYVEFFMKGGQKYVPCEFSIEGDWSGASCMLVAGAVAGSLTVKNLNPVSKQADMAVLDALTRAGAGIEIMRDAVKVTRPERLMAFEFDAANCPDLFPALVALAANCHGISRIYGAGRLRHKESDRARSLREEYGRMGIEVDISRHDEMCVRGGAIKGASVNSHADHRIAMSLAVAALNAGSPIAVGGAGSVDKSYSAFWDDLECITAHR